MITKIETERSDLFDVSILIAMRIHITGRMSEEKLTDAFNKAVANHEILNARVVIEEDGTAYYVSAEGNNHIFFENLAWQDIIRREEQKRFKIEDGEFLKAYCYESSLDGCSILFLMHHLGGDGKSLCYFIESFMKALSGEELSWCRIFTIPAGDMSAKALRNRLGPLAAFPKIFNKLWDIDRGRRYFSFTDMDKAYINYWKNRESDIKEYIISPTKLSQMLDRCRMWKIGLTAYISAMFLRKIGQKLEIGYAVDARTDHNRCMGNQATGISVKYAYNYKKSFRKNAEKIQKLMNEKLEDENARMFILPFMVAIKPELVDALNLEHAGTFHSRTSGRFADLLGYTKTVRGLSITNLTRLDIPCEYGEMKIDYFSFIPPVISYGKNIIGLSTLGNSTVLTLHRIRNTIRTY